jgi:hypothetical protein
VEEECEEEVVAEAEVVVTEELDELLPGFGDFVFAE